MNCESRWDPRSCIWTHPTLPRRHVRRFAPGARTACLYHFDEPVSPHLAAQRAIGAQDAGGKQHSFPTDEEFAAAVVKHTHEYAQSVGEKQSALYIESAGGEYDPPVLFPPTHATCPGVHSPTLSGSSQLDAFRPLLPPTLLIASHQLGGISTTISAYESLLIRGYDVDSVLIFREDYYSNFEYLSSWFAERGIHVGVVEQPPALEVDRSMDEANMEAYYGRISGSEGVASVQDVVRRLQTRHLDRITALEGAPRKTLDSVWWPFVQHGLVTKETDVMVIDSAHGDFFSVFQPTTTPASPPTATPAASPPLLSPIYDGSASWWTQCLGHAHPELTLAAAHASGRYGHILFPSATNLPALSLATRMVSTVGQGWASRCFFSDDGSTGMEVALKMALRAFAERGGMSKHKSRDLGVLGLKGSYHGDTMGAMDASEGGVFNERVEWYTGRGFWLDAPSVRLEQGKAVVRMEEGLQASARTTTYDTIGQVYDVEARMKTDDLVQVYTKQITDALEARYRQGGIQFGTLILEPVCMGAGGMIFVDPLFQRILVDLVRTNRHLFPNPSPSTDNPPSLSSPLDATPVWQGLPIIFDEVFVGLRRLGRLNGSSFLGTAPDIACYAKILTGGLVPMAVTLASDAIFQAFWGEKKVDALLHGHSYTAHPIGCSVANKTLAVLDTMESSGKWDGAKLDWSETGSSAPSVVDQGVWSLWDQSFVDHISHLPNVEGVNALGAVLSIHLRAEDNAGYQSTASESLLRRLRYGDPLTSTPSTSPGGLPFNIHARPLGNVVYFMSSLNSHPSTLRAVEAALLSALSS